MLHAEKDRLQTGTTSHEKAAFQQVMYMALAAPVFEAMLSRRIGPCVGARIAVALPVGCSWHDKSYQILSRRWPPPFFFFLLLSN